MEQLIHENFVLIVALIGSAPLLFGGIVWLGARQIKILRRYRGILDVDNETEKRQQLLAKLTADYSAKRSTFDDLRKAVKAFEETLEIADYGLYTPRFDFDTSDDYKTKLLEIRQSQKQMIKEKTAASCDAEWKVGGSRSEGKKMTNRYLKLILRAFNGECDALVGKVTWNNVQRLTDRLDKIYLSINKLGEPHLITISQTYYELKVSELHLAQEYADKRQQEKEEQRELREQMREEERVQKEIRIAEKKAADEETQYQRALDRARQELEGKAENITAEMREEIERLQLLVASAHEKKERAISRAQLTKSGHVYVISNLGSFGEGTYKIGMTRRLDPLDRVKELGDASVPFAFDIHALIYSENAPELEKQLHREFNSNRRNAVNNRKEFFEVSIEDIEAAVAKHHGTIEFTKYAEAREFRETISLRAESAAGTALDCFEADRFPLEI